MYMFMGEYNHSIDEKGRLIIPAKFRNQLGEQFIITRWMEKSLYAFSNEQWSKFEEKLNNLPLGAKDARAFRRFVLAGATEAEFDKSGRILIPSNLREHAEIKKEVVIAGSGSGFEIWNADNWKSYSDVTAQDFDKIAETLTDFDI